MSVIRRADGSCFKIVPELPDASPLDIPPLDVKLVPGELRAAQMRRHGDTLNRASDSAATRM